MLGPGAINLHPAGAELEASEDRRGGGFSSPLTGTRLSVSSARGVKEGNQVCRNGSTGISAYRANVSTSNF